MSNYPPGMSGRDFVRAGIVQPHHHEHEFELMEANPLVEDGAAIFEEYCIYSEGRHGEKYSCEETRWYRFEYDYLEVLGGGEIDLPTIENWDKVNDELEEVVIGIEEAYHNGDSRVSISFDPDKVAGHYTIEFLGYSLVFSPQ